MAALKFKPHWEALAAETRKLYRQVAELPFIDAFYMAGGTGLALQLGHRFSNDLDFFSSEPAAVGIEQRRLITRKLSTAGSFNITHDQDGTFNAFCQGIGLSFFRLDQHPLVIEPRLVAGIRIASVEDIGAMKLAAILSRGSKKDYIDLYFILKHTLLSRLFEVAAIKYPYHSAFPVFTVRALAFFQDAESDPMPQMILNVSWREVKSFLTQLALDYGKKILELEKLWPGA